MDILLNGFFDKNFGDDLMQLMIIDAMPEHDFFVHCNTGEMLLHLGRRQNVFTNSNIEDFDACVNVIGTGFLYEGKRAVLEKILGIPKEKKLRSEKTAVVDCSTVPTKSRMSELLVRRELKKYKFITCRDEASYKYISSVHPKAELHMYNDIVFGLDESLLPEKTGEGCLGFVPVNRPYSYANYRYFVCAACICDKFIKETGKKVLLFAFDTGTENDVSAALSIRSLMLRGDMAEIVAYSSKPKYIFENLARCGAVISSRFHGIVAALLMNIPTSAVYDTPKVKAIAKQFGLTAVEKGNMFDYERLADVRGISEDLRRSCMEDAAGHISALKDYLGR